MRISLVVATFIILWTTIAAIVVAFSGEVKAGPVTKCVYPGRVVYTDRECGAEVLSSSKIKTPKPLAIAKNWKPVQDFVGNYPTYRYIDDGYFGNSCGYCYSAGYNTLIYIRFNKPLKPAKLIPAKPTYHRLKPR